MVQPTVVAIPIVWSLRARRDVFPIAMAMTAAIIIVLSLIPHVARDSEEGVLLLMALWLIGASTAGGKWLLHLQRRWRAEEALGTTAAPGTTSAPDASGTPQ